MGKVPRRGKGALCNRFGQRDFALLDRHPDMSAQKKHQRHPVGTGNNTRWHNVLHGNFLQLSCSVRGVVADEDAFQNAYAADYDSTHFKDPHSFRPERYLDNAFDGGGTPHLGYGAGSRMCIGSHLANRELYTAFLRLISAFEITPSSDRRDWPILDALECNALKTSLTTEPKKFKVSFKARHLPQLEQWIAGSEDRTKDL